MTTKSSLAERLMRGILVERGEDGRLRAEGMTGPRWDVAGHGRRRRHVSRTR